jgi:hypothetical protein
LNLVVAGVLIVVSGVVDVMARRVRATFTSTVPR